MKKKPWATVILFSTHRTKAQSFPFVRHSSAEGCPMVTETESFRLGSPVCPKHKFWQKLQSLGCQYLPRKRLCSSVFLLLRLFQLCSYVLHPPRACGKHKDSSSFTQLRMAALHNNLLCRSEALENSLHLL